MAQQDKITTIDLIRAILARNRAAFALGVSLAAVVLGTSLVPLVGDRMPVTAVQTDLVAERAGMVTIIEAHAKQASTTLGRNYIAPEVLKAVSAVPRGLPPRHPRIGSPEAGMSKRGLGRARGSSA